MQSSSTRFQHDLIAVVGPSDEIEPLLRDHDQPQAPVDADCPWRARHLRRAPQPRSDSPPVTAWFPPLRSGVAIRPPAGLPRDQSRPPGGRRRAARRRQPLSHARPGRTRIASPNAPWIAAPLTTHPGGRVVVPGVLAVAKYPGRRAQANRSALPLDSGQNRIADEGAAAPRAIGRRRSQGRGLDGVAVTHVARRTTRSLANPPSATARRTRAGARRSRCPRSRDLHRARRARTSHGRPRL